MKKTIEERKAKKREHQREYYYRNKTEINRKNREYNKIYYHKNKERLSEIQRNNNKIRRQMDKKTVFLYYGMSCACCNENTYKFLTLDHINGGGVKHRKSVMSNFYRWIILNNFPSGYQTLCFNCNSGKWLNGGVCPHKECDIFLEKNPLFFKKVI